jgi:hypothetical protein
MPAEIRSFLGPELAKKLVDWSHTPDNGTPWQKVTHVTLDAGDLALLLKHGRKSPYSLHSARGQAINLVLLEHAFRDWNPERAALWMACLLHTVADEAACNHDPLIHYMTYAFQGGYKMTLGKGVGLDFAEVPKTEQGQKIIQALLQEVKPRAIATDPREALIETMMLGLDANAFMTQRGGAIAATYGSNASAQVKQDGMQALAELGVYGIQHGLDLIVTAWNFAQYGQPLQWDPELKKEAARRKAIYAARRPLSCDSIYSGLLAPPPKGAAVGVLIEPSISMNDSKLGYSSKMIMACVMRTLVKSRIPHRAVDVREMEKTGLPSPADMPVLAVCASQFNVSNKGREHLQAYVKTGGRLLWIGGVHAKQLGTFSGCLKSIGDEHLPVSKRYGEHNTAIAQKARISFSGSLEKALGQKSYGFTHSPDTRAGWQKPGCFYEVDATDPHVRVLAKLRVDDVETSIAACWMDDDQRARYVFLPEYLVAPYLLSRQTLIEDPSKLTLDDVGEKVFLGSLKQLAPVLVTEKQLP